jgi:hypothetical protein
MDTKLIPAIAMLTLSAICILVVLAGIKGILQKAGYTPASQIKKLRLITFVIAGWVLLTGILAKNGFFSNFSAIPPRPVFLIIVPTIVLLVIAFSAAQKKFILSIPAHWLIGLQVFRILVELILWRAVTLQLLPVQMSFEGYNFDIISGLLAVPVAVQIRKQYRGGWVLAYNIIGLILLINILVIAVLSMPTPLRQFHNEPANTLVGTFPFIYLPGVLVILAITLHVFSLRQWFLKKRQADG